MDYLINGRKKVEVEPYRISAPVAGKVIDIKDTNDQVFNR